MDNLLCQLDGTKRVMLWSITQKAVMEAPGMWVEEPQDGERYGAYADVDVSCVDEARSPSLYTYTLLSCAPVAHFSSTRSPPLLL